MNQAYVPGRTRRGAGRLDGNHLRQLRRWGGLGFDGTKLTGAVERRGQVLP